MPRHFFHTQTAARVSDEEGIELPNVIAARDHAVLASGELMKNGASSFWGARPWLITVTDHTGLILLEIEMHGHAAAALLDETDPVANFASQLVKTC